MKNIARIWIVAVALIVGGFWTLAQYSHGTSGFNFSWPVDGSKLSVDLTTTGVAVWSGILLGVAGLLLAVVALAMSIAVQFVPDKESLLEGILNKANPAPERIKITE